MFLTNESLQFCIRASPNNGQFFSLKVLDLTAKIRLAITSLYINNYLAIHRALLSRAVKNCQTNHPCNRRSQHRLTVYTEAYSHVEQGRSCHLCQTQFKGLGYYLCESSHSICTLQLLQEAVLGRLR